MTTDREWFERMGWSEEAIQRYMHQKEWGLHGSDSWPSARPIIVGEADPCGREIGNEEDRFAPHSSVFHDSDPIFALWPEPSRTSGARLCAIMGLHPKTFALSFDRTNLFRTPPEVWSEKDARIAAGSIPVGSRVVLLLGRRVHQAFGLAVFEDVPEPFWEEQYGTTRFLLLPHPSGINRDWNDVTLVPRLRKFLWLCLFDTHIPFGEADDSFGPEAREQREWLEFVRAYRPWEEVRDMLYKLEHEEDAPKEALIRAREFVQEQMSRIREKSRI